MGFPGGSGSKETACNVGDPGLIPGSGRPLGEGKLQTTPVLLPKEFHGQKSLVGYTPWGCKESDMTEQITLPPPPCLSNPASLLHSHRYYAFTTVPLEYSFPCWIHPTFQSQINLPKMKLQWGKTSLLPIYTTVIFKLQTLEPWEPMTLLLVILKSIYI